MLNAFKNAQFGRNYFFNGNRMNIILNSPPHLTALLNTTAGSDGFVCPCRLFLNIFSNTMVLIMHDPQVSLGTVVVPPIPALIGSAYKRFRLSDSRCCNNNWTVSGRINQTVEKGEVMRRMSILTLLTQIRGIRALTKLFSAGNAQKISSRLLILTAVTLTLGLNEAKAGRPGLPGLPAPNVNVRVDGYLPAPPGVRVLVDSGRPYYVERDRRVYIAEDRSSRHYRDRHYKKFKGHHRDHDREYDRGHDHGRGRD
jgi:hypothetical protein